MEEDKAAAAEACAVCGDTSHSLVWTVEDTLLGHPGRYNIVRCLTCGTLRVFPLPPFNERRRSFSDDYPLFDWALGRKSASAEERIARFHPQIEKINRLQRPGRLLDVGCGDGYFMKGMENLGWQARGIELNEKVAAFAREELALDVVGGAEHEVEWQGPYDVITLFGVLEDLDDPNDCLQRCFENLSDYGLLVVQTHNIASWEARFFGGDWFNIEAPRHLWHFSPGTLKELLERRRFTVNDVLHYGATYVTERSIENRRGRGFPSSAFDRVIRKVLVMPAAKVMPRLGQGIMIEAYCRKKR